VISSHENKGLLGRRKPAGPVLSQRERAEIAGKSFEPMCPHDHRLPNSVDARSVVGVIGNVGSSKSHYLTGLAYELMHLQPLRHLAIDVAYSGNEAQKLDDRVEQVFGRREILGPTEPGVIDGPFSYRLTTRSHGGDGQAPRAHLLRRRRRGLREAWPGRPTSCATCSTRPGSCC